MIAYPVDETCAGDVDELNLVKGEEPAVGLDQVPCDDREHKLARVQIGVVWAGEIQYGVSIEH